ncbi:twin-arginine translocation signal domain-containing protein [Phytoactinopolyspora alkaliphila]|uniref:Twin-arginine translocation signal domain-containing protein n=1 Tax=Phytoactinopolyspora alkaliphila TaxID=1783498 RepID=A0A6N9YSP4_9ACTN|nr:alkaline phosphatase D family protein [Phytoactinopolyspora alkaliphila]NED97970.1 twin-arginine translocation signal domain-containing protein [Phytoactinopolyspora alkaliphila]
MNSPGRPRSISRRRFLGYSSAGAAAVMLGTGWWSASSAAPRLRGNPFTLGVASGDPAPGSVVLWTRLAVEPFAPDGMGGMPDRAIPVQYQVAADERFSSVIRAGVAFATPELGHSVHPEVHGLEPGRHYWYRFRVGSEISPIGRTRTAPAPGAMPDSLSFAFASCQSYHGGHYTAFQHMVNEDLDLVVHLGDYIYEQSYGFTTDHDGNPLPEYMLGECHDLTDYRLQYALYKADVHLQAAHASCPWLTTFDDHEIVNNWAGADPSRPDQDPAVFRQRRAMAFQAMYENLPLRHDQMPSGPDVRIHRRLAYGVLADFTMLDSRQYQSARDGRFDPNATMLGGRQADWLIDGFSSSSARWQIIGNQMPMAQLDRNPDPDVEQWFPSSWDAYVVERDRLLTEAHEREVDNLVVVTGDRHSNYVMDLKADYNVPNSPVVGTEIVGTSISSGRDGADMLPVGEGYLAANPHMKFCNFQRGYSRVTVTPDELVNDFRVVPYVSEPDAPISTRASFVVENGRPGAEQA